VYCEVSKRWLAKGGTINTVFKAIRSLCDMTDLERCLAGDYAEDVEYQCFLGTPVKCKKSRCALMPSPKEILATDAALPDNKRNGEFLGEERHVSADRPRTNNYWYERA